MENPQRKPLPDTVPGQRESRCPTSCPFLRPFNHTTDLTCLFTLCASESWPILPTIYTRIHAFSAPDWLALTNHTDELLGVGAIVIREETRVANILFVGVTERLQKQGWGTEILTRLIAMAREKGVRNIRLTSSPQGMSLYDRMGWRVLQGRGLGLAVRRSRNVGHGGGETGLVGAAALCTGERASEEATAADWQRMLHLTESSSGVDGRRAFESIFAGLKNSEAVCLGIAPTTFARVIRCAGGSGDLSAFCVSDVHLTQTNLGPLWARTVQEACALIREVLSALPDTTKIWAVLDIGLQNPVQPHEAEVLKALFVQLGFAMGKAPVLQLDLSGSNGNRAEMCATSVIDEIEERVTEKVAGQPEEEAKTGLRRWLCFGRDSIW